MFASFSKALPAFLLFALVACQQGGVGLEGLTTPSKSRPPVNPPPQAIVRPPLSEKVAGQKIGNGPIRIALLLPTSAQGGIGRVGKDFANAAKLAVRDFGSGNLQVILKDTKGQSAQASIAASQARDEGSSLILGPLFSASVSSASGVTLPAKLPMIAFSSDTARARPGVYLLSFAPQADMSRTLNYGLSLGANRVVAFLPETAYGRIAEQQLRKTYDASGGQVVSVVRYRPNNAAIVAAANSAVAAMANANGIYIPQGGQTPTLILNALKRAGVSLAGKQIMGSGLWESVDKRQSLVNGAVFAGADKKNFGSFSSRYRSTYGSTPTVTAAVAYDAVSMAAELIRRNRVNPFNPAAIQSRAGFNGVTGLFRFSASGQLQRGLVVNKISNGQVTIVSPAPTSFGGS